MSDMIRIKPAPSRRVAFAQWAVAQRPKVRTVSASEFAVPPALFVQAPEDILIGAMVDGHRYISPEEDRVTGTPPPGQAPELLGVARPEAFTPPALPEQETTPGEPLSEAPASSSDPDSVPLPAPSTALDGPETAGAVPAAPEPARPEMAGDGDESAPYGCVRCGREFSTARGADTHRRRVHREG